MDYIYNDLKTYSKTDQETLCRYYSVRDLDEVAKIHYNRLKATRRKGTLEPGDCHNPSDVVTQEDWSEEYPPTMKLIIGNKVYCYDIDAVKAFLRNKDNTFVEYIPGPRMASWNSDEHAQGRGYIPGEVKYYKLYGDFNIYIKVDDASKTILKSKSITLEITSSSTVRIGNTGGIFGVSMLHGQAPGETVYTVRVVDREAEEYPQAAGLEEQLLENGVVFITDTGHSFIYQKYKRVGTFISDNHGDEPYSLGFIFGRDRKKLKELQKLISEKFGDIAHFRGKIYIADASYLHADVDIGTRSFLNNYLNIVSPEEFIRIYGSIREIVVRF